MKIIKYSVSNRTLQNDLKILVEKNIFEKIGNLKGTYYLISKEFQSFLIKIN